jgi:hypothetical protein
MLVRPLASVSVTLLHRYSMNSQTSLSLEEADLRRRYDTARRLCHVARSERLWRQVMDARRKAAENRYGSVFVTVRYREAPERSAVYLKMDLRRIGWSENPEGRYFTPLLVAQADCDLPCSGDDSPCDSEGPCPHTRDVFILPDDNDSWVYKRLAQQAGPQPITHREARWGLGELLRNRGTTNW